MLGSFTSARSVVRPLITNTAIKNQVVRRMGFVLSATDSGSLCRTTVQRLDTRFNRLAETSFNRDPEEPPHLVTVIRWIQWRLRRGAREPRADSAPPPRAPRRSRIDLTANRTITAAPLGRG